MEALKAELNNMNNAETFMGLNYKSRILLASLLDVVPYIVDEGEVEVEDNEDLITELDRKIQVLLEGKKNLEEKINELKDRKAEKANLEKEIKEKVERLEGLNKEIAEKVEDLIENLPDRITLEDRETVESARAAYDRLTDEQKELVTNLDKLIATEGKIKEIESDNRVEEEVNNFKTTHSTVLGLTEETVSISDKEIVNVALMAYDGLSEVAQGKLISEKTLLDSILVRIEELEKAETNQEVAQVVIDMIEALPNIEEITLEDKGTVEGARSAYDVLTKEQKALVTNLDKLEAAETRIAELEEDKAAEEKLAQAIAAAEEAIAALPCIEEVTIEDKAAVAEAKALVEAVKELDPEATVEGEERIAELEAKIEELEQEATDQEVAQAVIDKIEALPLVEELTLENKEAVILVRTAYDKLTEGQKSLVTNLDKLIAAEGKISELEEYKRVEEEVNNFKTTHSTVLGLTEETVSISDKEIVNAALIAYEGLSEAAQGKLTAEKALLDSLLIKIKELQKTEADKEAAQAVIDMIEALPEEITIEDKEAVLAARNAYEGLTEEQKALVTNLDKLIAAEERIAELELTVDEIGDETINGLNIVNRNYTDNSIKAEDIGKATLKINGKDVTEDFTFKFYNKENGTVITALDLSNGASTFKVFMEATSQVYNDVSGYVYFKYRSVTIGNNENYYTIEDALNTVEPAESDIIYVKYNTSFADAGISEEVYGSSTFTLKKDVTLLLPYDSTMSLKLEDTGAGNGAAITRNNAYVTLTMPECINLNVDGTIIVNGKRSAGTPRAGYITGKDYAQIHMFENSKITVQNDGVFNSIGFVYGEGTMEAESGAEIYDALLVTDFRGGSITSNVYGEVFPFDQYSFNNIEVPLTINQGASYYARSAMYAGGSYAHSVVPIVGKEGDTSLITLISGKIIKYFDTSTGKVTLDFDGNIRVNDLEMKVYVSVNTKDKEMPFPGNFQLNVKGGSTLILNAGVKLLPGAGLNIEEGAEFIITENGRLMVYDANEYTQSRGYPMTYKDLYRVEPSYTHSLNTPATFILNGTLTVNGGIAGKINTESITTITTITISPSASRELNIKHIEGGGGITSNVYSLKDARGNEVNAVGTYKISNDVEPWTTTINFVKDDGSDEITSIEQRYGENYIFPEWADESIIWYSEKDGGIPLVLTKVNIILYDTVYARRDVETKTITFETNGGETINPYRVPISSSINPNVHFIPIKTNAIFLGWHEDLDFIRPYNPDKEITEDLTIYARWAENGINITVEVSETALTNGDTIDVTATVKDGKGTPLKGIEIVFSGGAGEWGETNHITDSNGQAATTYKGINGAPNTTSILKETLKVTEGTSGLWESGTVDITVQANFSCPFVYSYDGKDYHFEHEAIPFAVNSALETTSYGTFRELEEIDGKYHVRIAEMLDEKSFVNGSKLIAVDYPAEEEIKEVFIDIFGNPHTIKNKELPLDFIDSNGNSYLDEITNKGDLVTSDYSKLYEGEYVTSYEAIFDKPENISDMAKLMLRVQKTNLITQSWEWFLDKLDATNNMWWIEKIMELPEYQDKFIDFVNMVNLRVELWDGEKWVNQGEIKAGRHLLEEFLVPLDLSIVNDELDQVRVRLVSGTGFFEIDQINIDYSEDNIINILELEPEEALFNNEEDVKLIIGDFDNNKWAKMKTGDRIDLVYNAPELLEGHERGFGVSLKGYYHANPDTKENPIVFEWEDLDLDGIIEALNNMEDVDAIETIPTLIWLNELIESLYNASLEEKIRRVIVEQILPWLYD